MCIDQPVSCLSSFPGTDEAERICAAQAGVEDDGARTLELLRNFGYHLATVRPSMAPLANAAVKVLAKVHQDLRARAGPFEVTAEEVFDFMHAVSC